jgi:hypothetical protein
MESVVLIASIVGLLGSLLPLLRKAASGWLRPQSTKIVITRPDTSVTVNFDAKRIDPDEIQKLVESLLKEDQQGQKPKADWPGSH